MLLNQLWWENLGFAFSVGWVESETFENNNADTHVRFLIGSHQSQCVKKKTLELGLTSYTFRDFIYDG